MQSNRLSYSKITLHKGFTLLELLIAIAIFSLVSVMAYGGLQTVITTKKNSQKNAERVAELQLFMLRVSNDLRQAIPRSIRNEYGDFVTALYSEKTGEHVVEWTTAGYRNPAKFRRSSLQRVAYQFEKQKVIRLSWPVLDRAQDTQVTKTDILSGVTSVAWRFMNNENEWLSSWPDQQQQAVDMSSLPKAVEITLELADWGKVKRLILLASET